MNIYVGSSLLNHARVSSIIDALVARGARVTYDWTPIARGYCENGFPTEICEEYMNRIGEAEKNGVRDCDVFFMVFPARSGTHVELGLALAYGKRVILLQDDHDAVEQKTFYYCNGVSRYSDEQEAIEATFRFFSHIA